MESSRQRRQRSSEPLERRFDQWIETGRQFVEGVSGARPGQRGVSRGERPSMPKLDSVGRWVGEKIDWIMDDDENWREPWQEDLPAHRSELTQSPQPRFQEPASRLSRSSNQSVTGKRSLQAISRRNPPQFAPVDQRSVPINIEDDWPDEDDFRVDRWSRQRQPMQQPVQEQRDQNPIQQAGRQSKPKDARSLPRSSRRRD